jgi:hypothetical protein
LFNIEYILETLSKKRPLFRSEKDFQESLLQIMRSMDMKCEANRIINGTKVDLWIEDGDKEILIQLKHKTKKLSVHFDGSQFDLKNHGAQDQGRYDFLKDVKSLEPLCIDKNHRTGFSILLTNDHRYWEKPIKHDSVDKDFQLYDGRKVAGILQWKEEASIGTKSGRENEIELKGTYELRWKNYSKFPTQDSGFRYLRIEV